MKTIGIIGGLSPVSTVSYYKIINDTVRQELGRDHSAKIILYSVDCEEFCELKRKGDWETQSKMLCDVAITLKGVGADFIVLATNTMHKVADDIQKALGETPFLHIADATADEALSKGFKTVAFLGTKYAMDMDFYTGCLESRGLKPLVPEAESEREKISRIIYEELIKGEVNQSSEAFYIKTIQALKERGAEAVILGCTEIGTLINEDNSPLPVLDTTLIHAHRAAKLALS